MKRGLDQLRQFSFFLGNDDQRLDGYLQFLVKGQGTVQVATLFEDPRLVVQVDLEPIEVADLAA
jgi:hypothetical protein